MLHQFTHELRRHAPMLFGWCVLLGLHLFLSGSRFVEAHSGPGSNGEGLIGLFVLVVVVLPLFFIPLVVQGDAPLDKQAFWVTRPLRGKTLFGAKLLLVGVFFILLPLGVEMAIIALRGGGSRTWLVVPEFLFIRGAVACVAFGAGTLAPRMLHAVVALSGLVILSCICLLVFVLLGGAEFMRTPRSVMPSRVMLFGLLTATGGLCSAFAMYRTKHLRAGHLIAGSGVVAGVLALVAWPWDLLGHARNDAKAAISYTVTGPARVTTYIQSPSGKQLAALTVPFAVSGRPDSVAMPVLFAKTRFVPDNGRGRVLAARQAGTLDLMDEGAREAMRGLFPEYVFGSASNHSRSGASNSVTFPRRFGGKDLEALRGSDAGEVTLEGASGWFTFEIAGELPLRKGAKWTDRGEVIEITRVGERRHGLDLAIATRELSQMFERERCAVASRNQRPWAFVVVNPVRKQAVWLQSNNVGSRPVLPGFSPLTGGMVHADVFFRSEFDESSSDSAGPAWLEEARLVIVRPVFQGVVPWDAGSATVPLQDN
jgi:hypothetical protein